MTSEFAFPGMDRRKRILDLSSLAVDRSREGCAGSMFAGQAHGCDAAAPAGTPAAKAGLDATHHQLLQQAWQLAQEDGSWRRPRADAAAGRGDKGARWCRRGAQPKMDRRRRLPVRGCNFAVQRGACCVHNGHRIRRCGGAAIAELSTTEAFAARTIRLLCRGLFSCVAMVHVRTSDA